MSLRKTIPLALGGCLFAAGALAQAPTILWQKIYGGTGAETGYSIIRTHDDGYAVLGGSASPSATQAHGQLDFWLVRTDSVGQVLWERAYGGTSDDFGSTVVEDADGNFYLAGSTFSSDGEFQGADGGDNLGVIKVDANGAVLWAGTYGGSLGEYPSNMRLTTDGGVTVLGYSASTDGDVSQPLGGLDVWMFQLSSAGVLAWERSFGGSLDDYGNDFQPTADHGYLVVGSTHSHDGHVSGAHGLDDAWVVKTDSAGAITWQLALGGSESDRAYSVVENVDGSFTLLGFSASMDGDVTGVRGGYDYWLCNVSASGALVWQKTLGGTGHDYGVTLLHGTAGGYLLSGFSDSHDGDVGTSHGQSDIWVVKVDSLGDMEWQLPVGGSEMDGHHDVVTSADGHYVVAGYTNSNDGDLPSTTIDTEFWVVKVGYVVVGVPSMQPGVDLQVHPNPSTGTVVVDVPDKLVGSGYQVLDLLGHRVAAGKLSGTSSMISLAGLPVGTYLLQVCGTHLRLMVER